MNRKIEFRGKKMTAHYEFIYGDVCQYPKTKWVGILNHESIICDPIEVDYKTLGQFTGLLDKNGVKIFEGDIVSNENRDREDNIYVCEYVNKEAIYVFCSPIDGETLEENEYVNDMIIIGNIHENQELIKI